MMISFANVYDEDWNHAKVDLRGALAICISVGCDRARGGSFAARILVKERIFNVFTYAIEQVT